MKKLLSIIILILIFSLHASALTEYVTIGENQTNETEFDIGKSFLGKDIISFNVNLSSVGTRNLSTQRCGVNQTGLVLCMYMDETEGTLVQDFSGNGLNGTWSGNASVNYSTGKINTGLSFDGVDDRITLGYPAELDFNENTSYTISVNLFLNGIGGETNSQGVVGHGFRHGLSIWDNTQRIMFGMRSATDASYIKTSLEIIELQKQTSLTVTHNASTKKITLFKNDIEVDSIIHNLMNVERSGLDNWIVGLPVLGGGGKNFNGTIDEVIIYARDWSPEEVRQNYFTRAEQIRVKTNSNQTYSSMWNSTQDNPISILYAQNEIVSSLLFDVPEQIIQDGVIIYDYAATTEFAATSTITHNGITKSFIQITELVDAIIDVLSAVVNGSNTLISFVIVMLTLSLITSTIFIIIYNIMRVIR